MFTGMPDVERLTRKLERRKASLADLCQLYRASSKLSGIATAMRDHAGEHAELLVQRWAVLPAAAALQAGQHHVCPEGEMSVIMHSCFPKGKSPNPRHLCEAAVWHCKSHAGHVAYQVQLLPDMCKLIDQHMSLNSQICKRWQVCKAAGGCTQCGAPATGQGAAGRLNRQQMYMQIAHPPQRLRLQTWGTNHVYRYAKPLEDAHDAEHLQLFEELLEAAVDLDRIPDEYLIASRCAFKMFTEADAADGPHSAAQH